MIKGAFNTLADIQSICDWNAARYEQELDVTLTHNLLEEEIEEFYDAETALGQLDGLVDVVYVAIGAMWKLGLSPEQIQQAIKAVCDSNDSKTVARTEAHVKANTTKGEHYKPPTEDLLAILYEAGIYVDV